MQSLENKVLEKLRKIQKHWRKNNNVEPSKMGKTGKTETERNRKKLEMREETEENMKKLKGAG